jgi:uncharacterized membrane protein
MFEKSNIEIGLVVFGSLILFALLQWSVKHLKIKHIWTIHAGIGALAGVVIILFLHTTLSDGTLRAFVVGDSEKFLWPLTIQNLMWVVFCITIMMLLAESKLASLDKDKEIHSLDNHIEGRLEPVRYLIWLIPTLGFLGTVVGMSFALSSLAGTEDLNAAINDGLLQVVMTNLGTAFYTTILGLIMNAICFGVLSMLVFKHKQVLAERQ